MLTLKKIKLTPTHRLLKRKCSHNSRKVLKFQLTADSVVRLIPFCENNDNCNNELCQIEGRTGYSYSIVESIVACDDRKALPAWVQIIPTKKPSKETVQAQQDFSVQSFHKVQCVIPGGDRQWVEISQLTFPLNRPLTNAKGTGRALIGHCYLKFLKS